MSPKLARAAVTGANGFVGVHLVEELLRRGTEVWAIKRKASPMGHLAGLPVKLVEVDALVPEQLELRLPASLDALFHVAGDASFWSGHAERQYATNVTVTSQLVEWARARGVGAFVFTSTAGALGLQPGVVLDENTPVTAEHSSVSYVKTKWLAEQAVFAAGAKGLPVVVMNPGTIIGAKNEKYWGRIFDLVSRGGLRFVPRGFASLCDVGEVAAAHVEAVERGALGGRFTLGGAEHSFRDVIGTVARLCGRPDRVREAPDWAIRTVGLMGELGALFTRREPLMTRQGAEYLIHRNRVSSARAQAVLGYRAVPLEAMLRKVHTWWERL